MMENWNSSENDTSNEMSGSGEPYTPILSGQALVLLSSLAGLVLVSLVFLWLSLSIYKGIMSKKDKKFVHEQHKSKYLNT